MGSRRKCRHFAKNGNKNGEDRYGATKNGGPGSTPQFNTVNSNVHDAASRKHLRVGNLRALGKKVGVEDFVSGDDGNDLIVKE